MPNLFRSAEEFGRSAEDILVEARKALVVMLGALAVLWALQIANWADGYGLDQRFGIVPRDLDRLPDIIVAPFLHFSWTHIEANSGPLLVFGFLAAYRGVTRFAGVTAVVMVTSGLGIWLFQGSNELTVGASGVIYGYFGYVVVKGLFDRRLLDVAVGLAMALSFAYILIAAVPGTPNVSWIGHLSGLAGGIFSGWLFREQSTLTKRSQSQLSQPGHPRASGGIPTIP
jgi:membrane associated rhomboid family serine protease